MLHLAHHCWVLYPYGYTHMGMHGASCQVTVPPDSYKVDFAPTNACLLFLSLSTSKSVNKQVISL